MRPWTWKSLRYLVMASALVCVTFISASAHALVTGGTAVKRWHGASDRSHSGATCRDYMFAVSMTPGQPRKYHVFGRLCYRGNPHGKTIQVLLPGGTYDHNYWDFPYQSRNYSYVEYLTRRGYATLDLDRLGFGYSSVVDPLRDTSATQAYVVHQVIHDVRSGKVGEFGKIIEVAHSLGSYVLWWEAGTYHDVNGVIVTGDEHLFGPGFVKTVAVVSEPAQIDPKWRSHHLPAGYITTYPGTRGNVFYDLSNVDPRVLRMDEKLKTTLAIGEYLNVPSSEADVALTDSINVPVLVADGENDYFCIDKCRQPLDTVSLEKHFYQETPCYEGRVIPHSAHDINLQKNARVFYREAAGWADRRIGASIKRPPTAPCVRP